MKRNIQISAIRLICTAAVVILHITQQMERLYAPIHMITDWLNLGLVMFFCISAFLYSQRDITNVPKWYLHRFLEIIIPSVLVGAVVLGIFGIRGELNAEKAWGTVLSCVGLQVYARNSFMFVQLWFLTYLLFFYLTVPLLQKINCKKGSEFAFWAIMAASVVALQGVTMLAEKLTGITLLSTGILLRFYLPYFVFKRYSIAEKEIRPVMRLFTVLSLPAIVVVAWVRYTPNIGIPEAVAELMFVYTQTIVGFVLFYWLYRAFTPVKTYSKMLKIADKYSYEVYLTHCMFIGYNTSLIWAAPNIAVGIVAALAATAFASVVIHYISDGIKSPIRRCLK
ncbi:MAG: acyltransferase [Oscillospiraceae bacterium]|nr:acyltransferase [Oscillospiraceae bacterium]MBQ3528978.1 acyltransferase [Oscillospiraceae bacterium]